MKTIGVKKLVEEVLRTLPTPYSAHVTDDVTSAIRQNEHWRRRYDVLCNELGGAIVNTWCGHWIARALGKRGGRQRPARQGSFLTSYSLLDKEAAPVSRKPNEQQARQQMADYYHANKHRLSVAVRQHREAIVELLMKGMPPTDAFAFVLMRLEK